MLIKKLNLSVTKKSLIDRDRQGQALKGEKNAPQPSRNRLPDRSGQAGTGSEGGVESSYLCREILSYKLQ